MNNNLSSFIDIFFLGFSVFIAGLSVVAVLQRWSLTPPPKKRDFGLVLSDWAQQRGLRYAPQQVYAINGVYNNRWFAIGTTNEENALLIRMRIHNPRRTNLQIFGDWLGDSGVIAFVSRFRVYSVPSGLSETLFDTGSNLRESLLRFPELRARLDLFSDPKDPNHLRYSLLTDLPGTDTLETILAAMHRFCDAFEQQHGQEGAASR